MQSVDPCPVAADRRPVLPVFVVAVFLSAFLVFQVQPMVSKHVTPWYGGTPAVWTTCLLVFQALLFAGYAYAHGLTRFAPRTQAAVHVVLLACASAVSILPDAAWKPEGTEDPLARIVAMLFVTVGLPYFALSATGPLLQAWFWRVRPGCSPYPLYAVSNVGSLLALLSYPFVVEPRWSVPYQAEAWRVGFALFALLCATTAWWVRGTRPSVERSEARPGGTVEVSGRGTTLLWLGWSACGVVLFMSVTNQMTLNVSAVPFLWIMPLSLYLLSFILVFGLRRPLPLWSLALLLLFGVGVLYGAVQSHFTFFGGEKQQMLPMAWQIVVWAAALFALCVVCHAWLHRLKPPAERATAFYLSLGAGGVIGGIVVAVIAPRSFLLYQEMHVGMLACCLLFLVSWQRTRAEAPAGRTRWSTLGALAGIVVLAAMLGHQTWTLLDGVVSTRRNFFGVLRVHEVGQDDPDAHALRLFDGSTLHGYQFVRADLQQRPTVYYSERTGIGSVLQLVRPAGEGRRIGVVGLGIGTLAAYGRPGDAMRFYEINPEVVAVAERTFSYLEHCAADWEVVLGDARLKLESEPDQEFDLLILDAFSSDSIPVHLLTVEAFDVYERHLAEGGVLAVHVSNHHLDLARMLYGLADERGLYALKISNRPRYDDLTIAAEWMMLSRDLGFMRALVESLDERRKTGDVVIANHLDPADRAREFRLWTDDYSNLLQILR